MHVFAAHEDLLQHGLIGGVREHAQLDLRVVGGDQHVAVLGLEAAADLAPERRADRDVLHVRVRAREAPGLRAGLQERRVDARALVDDLRAARRGRSWRASRARASARSSARSRARRGSPAARARRSRSQSCHGACATARASRRGSRRAAAARRSRTPPRRAAKISSSSASSSSRTRPLISARRSRFRRTPSSSISRSTATSGSSISLITRSRPRSAICSRCQAASAREQQRVGGERVLEVAGQTALFAQLVERDSRVGRARAGRRRAACRA